MLNPTRMRRFAPLVVSVAIHGALASRPLFAAPLKAVEIAASMAAIARGRVEHAASIARREAARRALILEARQARARGALRLGDFLLRANAIDAEEAGAPIDAAAVRALYDARVAALAEALARASLREAVAEVFADLHYVGDPGGLLADALVDRGGSCEPLSQLVVATAFDAGKPRAVSFRYYGGASAQGVAHVAPIAVEGREEIDLLTGKAAFAGGARLAPEELVDVYARAHGIDAPEPERSRLAASHAGAGGAAASSPEPERASSRPSMMRGFPPNEDRYPGSLPLFSSHAIAPSGEADAQTVVDDSTRARDTCGFALGMNVLDPPKVEVMLGASTTTIEIRRALPTRWLDLKAAILAGALENASSPEPADALFALACATATARDLAADFSLAGDPKIAALALESAKTSSQRAAPLLERAKADDAAGATMRADLASKYAGQAWLLLVLEGAGDVAYRIAITSSNYDWGQIDLLAALVIQDATRGKAMEYVATRPLRDRVDVFHEVLTAHRSLRPWASSYDLGDAPTKDAGAQELARAYRVFRRVGYALWIARSPVEEATRALAEDARAAGLSRDWEAAILEYYARNELGLRQHQEGGFAAVAPLRAAVERMAHPALAQLTKRLVEIEGLGTLDPVTLTEAWRLR